MRYFSLAFYYVCVFVVICTYLFIITGTKMFTYGNIIDTVILPGYNEIKNYSIQVLALITIGLGSSKNSSILCFSDWVLWGVFLYIWRRFIGVILSDFCLSQSTVHISIQCLGLGNISLNLPLYFSVPRMNNFVSSSLVRPWCPVSPLLLICS